MINSKTPAFLPRSLSLQVVQPNRGGQKLSPGMRAITTTTSGPDLVGIGSQLDGLGHLGEGGLYYNCLDEKDIAPITGLTKPKPTLCPLVGRGVVLI